MIDQNPEIKNNGNNNIENQLPEGFPVDRGGNNNGNIGMKVLSVFIAILIWLLVANTNDPVITRHFINIPVKVTHESVLANKGYAYQILDGSQVSFVVRGKKSLVQSLDNEDFQAVADLRKLSLVDAVPIDVTAKRNNGQLEISLGNTNTLRIKRDRLVTVSVPVNIETSGKPADGFAVGTTTGTPNLIKVKGPKNVLSNVKEIRVGINVSGAIGDLTSIETPVLYDGDGNRIDDAQINISTKKISVAADIWKTKDVEVKMGYYGTPKSGYKLTSFDYEPKKITVAAPNDVLEDLDTIYLDDVSIEGMDSNYEKDINITEDILPDNVILADEDTKDIKIQANIDPIISKKLSFDKSQLKVKNLGKYDLSYASGNKYAFTVEGPKSTVEALGVGDFKPWIDMSGLEEGEHEVKIHVKEVKGVTVSDSKTIKVVLTEK